MTPLYIVTVAACAIAGVVVLMDQHDKSVRSHLRCPPTYELVQARDAGYICVIEPSNAQ